MNYSVAIRTLGLNPTTLRSTLESVFAQTLVPERVVVYIAGGYTQPDFRVGTEEYAVVAKGMMRQRALRYDELPTEYILMLDDDIRLHPGTVSLLLGHMERNRLDAIGADVFKNHALRFTEKLKAALSISLSHTSAGQKVSLSARGDLSPTRGGNLGGAYPLTLFRAR